MSYITERPDKISGLSHIFSPLPNWILSRKEISSNAKMIYARLLQYKGKKDHAYPRRQELADECGLEVKTVARGLQELKKNNLIFAERRGNARSNAYKFLVHPWMSDGKTYKSKSVEAQVTSIDKIDGTDLSSQNKIDGTDLSSHDGTDLSHPYEKIIENKKVEEKRDFSTTSYDFKKEFKEEFEEFWNEYPLKRHKKLTSTNFITAREIASFADIMKKVKSYKRMAQHNNAEKFYMSSHKWLEEERWNDDYGEFEKEWKATEALLVASVLPEEYKDNWEIISKQLKERKGKALHKSWFEKICLACVKGDTATIYTAGRFVKNYTAQHFSSDILPLIQDIYPSVSHLKFKVIPPK